jgi:endonuclease YncB( thermonuclease family)
MSRHWRPEGEIARILPVRERGPWGSVDDYLPRRRRRLRLRGKPLLVSFCLGALFVGLASYLPWRNWPAQAVESAAAPAIEWDAVHAVPARAPDAADIEWQKRAEAPLASAADQPSEAAQAGLPHPSGTRNDAIYVIDGDTFAMGSQTVRVAGIDAPETHPSRCADEARLGLAATQKLRQLLGSGTVRVSGEKIDKYGREVREVTVGGRDVAEIMIGEGLARSYDGEKRLPWCS